MSVDLIDLLFYEEFGYVIPKDFKEWIVKGFNEEKKEEIVKMIDCGEGHYSLSLTKEEKRVVMSVIEKPELYPNGVARCFGNIEFIIDKAFHDKISALETVNQIQDKINEIKEIIAEENK